MSRRNNYWANAVAESFFSSLKKERIRRRVHKIRELARADVFDDIEVFYNRTRRHTHLSGISHQSQGLRKSRPGVRLASVLISEAVQTARRALDKPRRRLG